MIAFTGVPENKNMKDIETELFFTLKETKND